MEAQTIHSMYQLGHEEQANNPNFIIIGRIVYNQGLTDIQWLRFSSLLQIIDYFNTEEQGTGVYDTEDQVLVYFYDLPTGEVVHIYTFYHPDTLQQLVSAFPGLLEEYDLPIDTKQRVLSTGNLGFVYGADQTSGLAVTGEPIDVKAVYNANASKQEIIDTIVINREYPTLPSNEKKLEFQDLSIGISGLPMQETTSSLIGNPLVERGLYGIPPFRSWRM